MADQEEKPFVGKFEIVLHGARDLPKADLVGRIDAYAVVIPQDARFGKTFTTPVVKSNYNPKWKSSKTVKMSHQTYTDIYDNQKKSELAFRIEVYDKDAVGEDDYIGVAEITTDQFRGLTKSLVPIKVEPKYASKSKSPSIVVSTLWFKQFKAGGGSSGKMSAWNTAEPLCCDGWEMKFRVDEEGNVSGKNKNDSGPKIKKKYSGTFKDGKLDCIAVFKTGQQNTYKGSLVEELIEVDGKQKKSYFLDIRVDVIAGKYKGDWRMVKGKINSDAQHSHHLDI
eukprot:CAMPEP_0177657544 /NCGR_PEP_ID=MMETSP0447-20121125/16254_1 /TAXON_ID=0 /ORGANISM="Stygamoeba regulata, Strain BSH-02190019" /LENGTH=280 /DNA_ID=CAMNT_0019161931 /DNA_START=48 /DNA_END=890 /DNA_ORIENTATION=+